MNKMLYVEISMFEALHSDTDRGAMDWGGEGAGLLGTLVHSRTMLVPRRIRRATIV